MTVFFSPEPDCFGQNNQATMYIRYKDGSEDTLRGEFNANRGEGSVILTKFWVNNKLEWGGYPGRRTVFLIK